MTTDDRIYDVITIRNPLIIELINTRPFQRLRHISQDGASHFIQPVRNVTRYEHSIGVWYLSFIFNRPIEEQVASLLHDIPHTAFSHVIDFVMKDEKHEFHEKFMKDMVMGSEIPGILKRYSVDVKKVLEGHFPLLENDLPDISMDRLDYFLRDGYSVNMLPKEIIDLFLKSIREKNSQFYFEDLRTATTYAILFMNFSRLIWLDPTSHGAFFLLSEALKIALVKGFIAEQDFFLTDTELMTKLVKADDEEIDSLLTRLKPGQDFSYASKNEAEFYGPNKPRFVDPLVQTGRGLRRVSEMIPGMSEYFEEFKSNHKYIGVRQSK